MKLLVLDLDETLIYATEQNLEREPDFEVGSYAVYRRPGLADFLAEVSAHFKLAVWTSSTRAYAEPVVANIFPPEIELKFVWARERCTRRYDHELHHEEWAKNLSKLKRIGYALEQVLMLDDTPAKLSQHYGNLVRIKPYFGAVEDQELWHLARYLPTLAAVPNVRAIEKRFWRSE